MDLGILKPLLPIFLPKVPTSLMGVGMKMITSGSIKTENGKLDLDRLFKEFIEIARSDDAVARDGITILLRGLGYPEGFVQTVTSYVYDAPDGHRTEEEYQKLVQEIQFFGTPQGRVQLPFGCKECGRGHFNYDFETSSNGHPICVRCGREIKLKG